MCSLQKKPPPHADPPVFRDAVRYTQDNPAYSSRDQNKNGSRHILASL